MDCLLCALGLTLDLLIVRGFESPTGLPSFEICAHVVMSQFERSPKSIQVKIKRSQTFCVHKKSLYFIPVIKRNSVDDWSQYEYGMPKVPSKVADP
jgi:hypothetical protein